MAIITKADGTKVTRTMVKSGGKTIVTEKNISTGATTTKVYGSSSSSSSSKSSTPTTAQVAAATSIITTPSLLTQVTSNNTEANKMTSAGASVSGIYNQLDTAIGGVLPGGVEPTSKGVGTALKVAGATTGVAVAAGIGYAAYKYFTKDGKQRKIRADGQPYKQPRMNYANPRALSRATRRLVSFKNHYAKSVRALGYHVSRTGGK